MTESTVGVPSGNKDPKILIYDTLKERVIRNDYTIENVDDELKKITKLLKSIDAETSKELGEWFYAMIYHHELIENGGSFKKVAYGPKVAGTGQLKMLTYLREILPPILQTILILFFREVTE